MVKAKVVYQDSTRRVTKDELKSEMNPNGAVKYSQCDYKRCRGEAHYLIELPEIPSWINHVCKKHMKTMTAKDVRDAENKVKTARVLNEVWTNLWRKN
jgi:hypothetical protein